MNPNRFFLQAATSIAVALGCSFAQATPLQNTTGLDSPTTTITFDEHVVKQDTLITTQYSDLGVTFTPGLYYAPYDQDAAFYTPIIAGYYLSNYTTGQDPAQLASFSILFSSLQTRAAFGLAANDSSFSFKAYRGDDLVESFTDDTVNHLYYGFTDSSFDRIVVTSTQDGSPDFFDFDNVQFGGSSPTTNANDPSVIPEPESAALLGLGVLAAVAVRRRARKAA